MHKPKFQKPWAAGFRLAEKLSETRALCPGQPGLLSDSAVQNEARLRAVWLSDQPLLQLRLLNPLLTAARIPATVASLCLSLLPQPRAVTDRGWLTLLVPWLRALRDACLFCPRPGALALP